MLSSTRLLRDAPAATPEMLAAFGDEQLLRAALDFEAALAAAQAQEGLIPQAHATAIETTCRNLAPDIPDLARQAAHAGTLAIPLVALLREAVGAPAAASVHFAATSQDLSDTVLAMQAKIGVILIDADLHRLDHALTQLARSHAQTPCLGRTLLQPARATSLGLRLAGWALGMRSAAARLRREADSALVLQLGGAVGTLAGMGGRGGAVSARLAASLGPRLANLPWHARRGDLAALGCALALVTEAAAKMARDISLLAQSEIAEIFEPRVAGRGGSSAMPHKQNQTGCQVALSAALRAPGLAATMLAGQTAELERGIGGWQTDAPILADLFCLTHAAVRAMADAAEGLRIDAAAMARNLDVAGFGNDIGEAAEMVRAALG